MTDQPEMETPLTDAEVVETATATGVDAMMKVHAIEREMLSRAVLVITRLTGKTPEETIAKLCEGLDEAYEAETKTVEASANVAKLYVPNRKLNL
jgi:hypothetical protein